MQRAHKVDRVLSAIVAILIVVGLLTFLSASFGLLFKGDGLYGSALLSQLGLGLCGGLAALFVVLQIPLKLVRRVSLVIFGVSLLITLMVFVPHIGLSINGARRWLDLGFTTIQPSEFIKIGYVMYVAAFIASAKNRAQELWQGVVPFVCITAVIGVILLLQPDTDTFLIIAAAGFAMMFAAGLKLKDLAILLLAGVLMLGVLVALRPYLLDRVQTFLNPLSDPQGSGYQIQQSLIAVGSGQVLGRGFGQSLQKFSYLPEASSDSIFAVYAEEFGFIGSLILVLIYVCFALRGMWLAARSIDLYAGLVIIGLTVIIAGEAFLNMAAMLGIAPVGGLPLPFISHGGTALFATLAMVGLVLQASRTVRT